MSYCFAAYYVIGLFVSYWDCQTFLIRRMGEKEGRREELPVVGIMFWSLIWPLILTENVVNAIRGRR